MGTCFQRLTKSLLTIKRNSVEIINFSGRDIAELVGGFDGSVNGGKVDVFAVYR